MPNYNIKLEDLCRMLNLEFADKTLLLNALTHSSFANQKKNIQYNERMEFLGDSILQMTVTEYLYNNHMDKTEGELTKLRALIVCENSLFHVAKTWNLGKFIYMSKGEELTGGRNRISIQSDCVEAIIAAIYLDKGIEFVKEFILKTFKDIINKAIKNEIVLDYKTKLQELLQKNGDVEIKYILAKYEGPPHRRKFFINVQINNESLGEGTGYSKKEAEQAAAQEALERLEANIG